MSERIKILVQQPRSSEVQSLKRNQLFCFYEPLILLKALTDISHEEGKFKTPERRQRPHTEEEMFYQFVDKLANVCHGKNGGKTVTALTALEAEDAYIYVFGCNEVSEPALRETAEFVATVLRKIAGANQLTSPREFEAVKRDTLNLLVGFNQERIEKYIHFLKKNLAQCIESCTEFNHEHIRVVEERLRKTMQNLVRETEDDGEYLDSCLRCFAEIRSFRAATTTNWFIEKRADEGRLPGHSMACWSELRHYLTRLISFEDAVAIFIETEAKWPELFQEFQIWPIVSSTPSGKPLRKKSETARSIIGRMTSDPGRIENYRKLAEGLQTDHFDLDGRLKKRCQNPSFKPIVHCEVLVLDWIVGNSNQLNFFQGFEYIGTSKGACKLCDYYFKAHPSSIKARPTHGNMYPNWAFPDVFTIDGQAAAQKRQNILNSMMRSIRNEAFLVLEKKSPTWKRHDSSTYGLVSQLQVDSDEEAGGSDTSTIEELTNDFKNLDSQPRSESSTLSDSDDEAGGVSLG